MKRRSFVTAAAALPAITALASRPGRPASAAEAASLGGWRVFEVTTRITLSDSSAPAQMWVPLAQTLDAYQQALEFRVSGTGQSAQVVHDGVYGSAIYRADWSDAAAPHEVEVTQIVATSDRTAGNSPFVPVARAERDFWLQPSDSIPTDGIVADTAARIVGGRTDPRDRLRAIYDWVVDNTFRDAATRGCGVGDVRSMLQTGRMGGKCADINSLMVGLTRAAGIPARDVYGIRVADSRQFKCLGASGTISKAQHCRVEAYLEGAGWFPLDPADVRKVVLEAKLPLASDEVKALRERLFGSWEMNWIGYNRATDIKLPGAPSPMNSNFLMYPCAMTAKGELDCLDPTTFRYEITSREAQT